MPSSSNRRRVDSATDDKGLAGISFVLHGNSSILDSEKILRSGLMVQEGRATVSTDIGHALRWATASDKRLFSKSKTHRNDDEAGAIFVIAVPRNMYIGYGVHTSVYVDDMTKEVSGAPVKFASGRKQLAFYHDRNTELLRQQYELSRQATEMHIPAEAIVAIIQPSDALVAAITEFDTRVKNFLLPPTSELKAALRQASQPVLLEDMIAELVRTTIESIVISRLRNLELNVYRALGYKIFLEDKSLDAKKAELDVVMSQVANISAQVLVSGFTLGSDWLTGYAQARLKSLTSLLATTQ